MKHFNILCIDDQETNLFLIESYLKQTDQFDVHCVDNGQEGLRWLSQSPVDLIILDIIMPEMDGFEMAARIRSNPLTRSIPIIFITMRNDEQVVQEAFDNGGNDCISKPIKSTELIARIKMHLSLSDKNREIRQKILLIEQMIEKQNNLIFITDGTSLIKANKAFLEYSGFDDIKTFNQQYPHIDDFFRVYSPIHEERLITNLLCQTFSDLSVFSSARIIELQMEGGDAPVMFKADAVYMGSNYDFIITMTDVSLYQEEKNLLLHHATHDHLTGLYNRRAMNDYLEHFLETARRYRTPFSVILFDIDNFKQINDTLGHLEGDNVIKNIAQHIQKMRKSDIGCRYGGEEFLVILPETKIEDAYLTADLLRMEIQNDRSLGLGAITCSFGIAQFNNDTSFESILSRADIALYHAKSNGKNRIEYE